MGFRALLALELPAPRDAIFFLVERHLLSDGAVQILDQRDRIAVVVVELDEQIALVHLAIDHALAGLERDVGDL